MSSILIVPDKFKGTLTATEAAEAIATGWKKARPDDELDLVAMSDGGDGFGEVVGQLLGAKRQQVATVDAAHRKIDASWWWDAASKTAILESAQVIGLAQLPEGKYHPFDLDTLGLAKMLLQVAKKGARRCFIGIGGSATNDGGFGMALGLGWKFFGPKDKPIEKWTELETLTRIEAGAKLPMPIIVAMDVSNPLLGPTGASRVYGPQKGLRKTDFAKAEAQLRKLAEMTAPVIGRDWSNRPGAGAAGGLGFGLFAFLQSGSKSGFELFSEAAELPRRIRQSDVVVTGEGSLDLSTLMGKGVGEVARLARRLSVPCIGIGGRVTDRAKLLKYFPSTTELADVAGLNKALHQPKLALEMAAEKAAKDFERTGKK